MKSIKIFASDIDNTLTDKNHLIPKEVEAYLAAMHKDGWKIFFLTGRTFSFAKKSIGHFDIPYHLAVQNGAEVFEMPGKRRILKNFLEKGVVESMVYICQEMGDECIIYSGSDGGDFCYYRPGQFSPDMLKYLDRLKLLTDIKWVAFDKFSDLEPTSFPLVKCIGKKDDLEKIRGRILEHHKVNSFLIRDSIDPNLWILMITHEKASKGLALDALCKQNNWTDTSIIAAGDDENDICLLQRADIGIAMRDECKKLVDIATIIGKSSHENGIIEGLEKALKMVDH